MNKKEKSHPVSKKKQTVGIIVFSIMILLLTGCFNITQHISKEGNDLNVFIKFAVSKKYI